MQIWVDADACPRVIKEILFRAAERVKVSVILLANSALRTPPSLYIATIQVSAGFNVADNHIVQKVQPGDLVITADIPLAAEVIGGFALNPRGEFYSENNVFECLAMRNLMQELRSGGEITGGPPPISMRDRQAFANQLDRFLAKEISLVKESF
ncbi:MAG: YaiI/YqxD family protein [Candidatus Schekmanbacteria bacterium]|nr:YaiI/YqxD family protein [Candidatus Schekmanbacteria bacterium]